MELTRKLLDASSMTADRRLVTVICSTGEPDRAGDVIVQSGIDLTAYRRNPVVLWGHSADMPVAKTIEIGIASDKLRATVQFPPDGDDEDSDWVFGKIKAGIVNATSIGFLPKEYSPLDPKQPWNGFKFSKSELLEFSFCSVPANAGCLIVGRSLLNPVQTPLLPSLARSQGNTDEAVRIAGRRREIALLVADAQKRLAPTGREQRVVEARQLRRDALRRWGSI